MSVVGVGDWLRVRLAACMISFGSSMGWVGEVMHESGYVCV